MKLKIENIKKGDNLFCIKDLEITTTKRKNKEYFERFAHLSNKEWTDMTNDEIQEYLNHNENETITYTKFKKGKPYKITNKLGIEITVKGEISDEMVSKNDSVYFKSEEWLNEYFTSSIEGRKFKLQELSDINFNNFLSKLKK